MSGQQSLFLKWHRKCLEYAAYKAVTMAEHPETSYREDLTFTAFTTDVDIAPYLPYERILEWVLFCDPLIEPPQRKSFLRPFDYLIQIRWNYFTGLKKYRFAYNCLQDAKAFHIIMLKKAADVEKEIEELEGREGYESILRRKRTALENIIMQIDKNTQETPRLLAELQKLKLLQNQEQAILTAAKEDLITRELPRLYSLAMQMHEADARHRITNSQGA